MAAPRDESLSRSLMLLCASGAGLILLFRLPQVIGQVATWQPGQSSEPALPGIPKNSPEIIVDLRERRIYLYTTRRQKLLASYPIAVAQKGWDTPRGGFRVLQKVTYPAWIHPITGETFPPGHRKNPLGSRWIGFAKAQKLQFGFHGTNQEELIGQEVSHGCLRMRNEDVEALYSQIEVGAPVEVRP